MTGHAITLKLQVWCAFLLTNLVFRRKFAISELHIFLANDICGGFMFFHTHNSNPCRLLGESAVSSTEENVYYIYAEKDKACQYIINVFMSFTIIGGSCYKYNFCRDKSFVFCISYLSRQNKLTFVTTKHVFCHACRDKYMFVVTNSCRDKSFVARNTCLSRQKFCRSKHTFVATKIVLVAAPANDNSHLTHSFRPPVSILLRTIFCLS